MYLKSIFCYDIVRINVVLVYFSALCWCELIPEVIWLGQSWHWKRQISPPSSLKREFNICYISVGPKWRTAYITEFKTNWLFYNCSSCFVFSRKYLRFTYFRSDTVAFCFEPPFVGLFKISGIRAQTRKDTIMRIRAFPVSNSNCSWFGINYAYLLIV